MDTCMETFNVPWAIAPARPATVDLQHCLLLCGDHPSRVGLSRSSFGTLAVATLTVPTLSFDSDPLLLYRTMSHGYRTEG